MFAGFTNTGSPSCSASAPGVPGVSSCSRTLRHRAWGMPHCASTCLAIALSIESAEASTPEPT